MTGSVELIFGDVVEKSENCAEKFTLMIKPHAKGLAKFGILFFHIMISLLIVFRFTQASLFIGYSLGLKGEPVPCLRQDVEFEGEDLEGNNPVKAKTLEVCLEGCRAFNMEQEQKDKDNRSLSRCKAVTFTNDTGNFLLNCWMKKTIFEESEMTDKPGFYSRNLNCKEHDDKSARSSSFPKKATNLMTFLTILLLISRVVSLVLIVFNKHILPACALLAVPCIISAGIQVQNLTKYSHVSHFSYLATNMSLVGCLMMVVAESMEEKDLHLVGLPSWGINKKMSYITLISRINIVLIFFGAQMIYGFGMHSKHGVGLFVIAQIVVLIPIIVSVVVGYKTKVMSVILASWLTIASLITHPFFLRFAEENPFRFWLDAILFGVSFSGVGSLIYISVLGAGAYSVDHAKKQ